MQNEFEVESNLQHPNIVNYDRNRSKKDAVHTNSNGRKTEIAYLILENIPNCFLNSMIEEKGRLPERICRLYFKQLLLAFHYLHSNGICQRDVS